MEEWYTINKKADFQEIGRRFGIDPVTARIIRNRDIVGEEAIDAFLNGGMEDLGNPHLMKDADRLVELLQEDIRCGRRIRIIGDYDIDGVMSTFILLSALKRCGADVSAAIPDRIRDGYGLNVHLIDQAYADGVDTILTCDNGISALDEIAHAVQLGMRVLVTDHHELPFRMEGQERIYLHSKAEAVVNPHQPDCAYPYKELCGTGVAWRIICLLYEAEQIDAAEAEDFLEFTAFATVGDIVDLTGENRILVKEGLKRIHRTKNTGMRALIARCGLQPEQIDAWHFGFVLGPCINASGRLDTAQRALSLFFLSDEREAARVADELVVLNAERKEMTERGVQEAIRVCETEGYLKDDVLVIYLPDVHESIAGIIAGRIREKYYKPTFVLTKGEEGVKGSGRSVDEYSMYEEMCRCRECFTAFGGHPMAAGLSMPEDGVERFRERINALCPGEARGLARKTYIDVPMPIAYAGIPFVRELDVLAPFGKANPKPLFADRNLAIRRLRKVGRNQNVLKVSLQTETGHVTEGVFFGEIPVLENYLMEKFGEQALADAYAGRTNVIRIAILYYPRINSYQGRESLEIEIKGYR